MVLQVFRMRNMQDFWLSSYGSELIQNLFVNQLHFSIFSDFLIWNLRKTIHQGCHLPYFLEFSRTQNRIQIFHLLLEECPSFLNQTLLPEKKKKEYHLSTSNFYIYWQGLRWSLVWIQRVLGHQLLLLAELQIMQILCDCIFL